MSNNLQLFNFENNSVKTALTEKGEPLFCLADVCKILDITNITDVSKRLESDELDTIEVVDSLGRRQEMIFISEGNLYLVIFQSRKEEAKKFRKWVISDVLPTLRKTGSYHLGSSNSKYDGEQIIIISPMEYQKQLSTSIRRLLLDQRRKKIAFEVEEDEYWRIKQYCAYHKTTVAMFMITSYKKNML